MLSHWLAWKERCTIERCEPPAQEMLRSYGRQRFLYYIRRYITRTNVTDELSLMGAAGEPWYRFESHLLLRGTKAGKRYKDWLFARLECSKDADIDVIQGGATLLMRDVVRDFLFREYSSDKTVSMQRPIEDGAGFSLEDMLPVQVDPVDALAEKEFREHAEVWADRYFNELDERERLVMVAKEKRIPLNDPYLCALTGCGKSTLSMARRTYIERIGLAIRAEYIDDDIDAVIFLVRLTLEQLAVRVMAWAEQEAWYVTLLNEEDGEEVTEYTETACIG